MLLEQLETLFDRCKATIDRRSNYALLKRKFERTLGYPLDLENPKTWNEKIQWRKINVRNPDYVRISDKLDMRDFVREKIGAPQCDGLFTKIYAQTDNPATLNFTSFPARYVIKPTHGSGWVTIVQEDDQRSSEDLQKQCKRWLARRFGHRNHEWAYLGIKPRIMVEELLCTTNGDVANDVKVHVVGGKIVFVYTLEGRFEKAKAYHLNMDWQPVFSNGNMPKEGPVFGWEKMKDVSLRIGQYFDYVRVDFLSADTQFALNELTLYPRSGLNGRSECAPILDKLDILVGDCWAPTVDGLSRC